MGNHKTFWPWMLLLMISMTVSGEFSVTKYSSRREELSLLKNLLKVLEQLVKDQSTKMEKIGGELHAINKKMPNDIGGNKKDIMDNISSVPIEIKRQDAAIINLEIKQQLFESNLKDIVRESKEIASNVTSIAVENEIQNASITQHEEKQESLERKLKDLESESKEIASNVTSIAVENEIQNASITQHEEKQQSLERKLNDLESESKEIMNNIRSLKTKSERQDATIAQYYVKQLSLERELIAIDNRLTKNSNMVSSIQSKLNDQQSTMNRFQTRQSSMERKVDRGIGFTALLDKSIYTLKNKEKIVFGHVISNYGNAYDGKSGIFTSPKNGIYGFYYNIHTLKDKFALVELTSNGDKYHSFAYAGSHSSDSTDGSTFVVLYLSKGERVWLRAAKDCSVGETMKYHENNFSGFLIHSY